VAVLEIKQQLVERARDEGFELCRVTKPDAIPEAAARLKHFLQQGYHGDMGWMAEHEMRRSSPQNIWPEAQSVVMLAMNYGPEDNPLDGLAQEKSGLISVYAQRRDYHDVMKKKLRRLASWLAETGEAEVKLFVDTAPVMEKPLAAAAGLGWQGKHTNLVSRDFGSWLFLGSIFTTLDLPTDAPEQDHCGQCTACLEACPTNAFPAPYQLDARRCISYLTIEHKGVIEADLRRGMGNHIYGCDDCLAVCPWNKFAKLGQEAKLAMRDELSLPDLIMLSQLDDDGFRGFFAGLPIKRTGRDRFVRNVMIALGNISQPSEADKQAVLARLDDVSPLVRGMAVWALGQLDPAQARAEGQARQPQEQDEDVQAEWQAVMA
jgi:epoxyqueuosine reductase